MQLKIRHIFILLSCAFLIYSGSIYFDTTSAFTTNNMSADGVRGKAIWQKHNCQSCHQLYGLGGYLGPDLTNVYSAKGKGEIYIAAMIKTGSRQMPAFDLTVQDTKSLIAFLKATDASGNADPRTFTILNNGMIESK